MKHLPRPLGLPLAVATAAVLTAALAGCAGSADASAPVATGPTVNTSPDQHRVTTTKNEAAAALVPAPIRARGTLVVGGGYAGAGSAPLGFTADDNKTPIGVEVDLAHLVAQSLGLSPDVKVTSWENLFVGLDSGRYDVGFSNITVTEKRKEKYDFATYRKDNLAFEAKKGSTWKVNGPRDVAGKTIAVASGTNQEKLLVDWTKANEKAGLAPTTIRYYQSQSDYYLALASGRIDAYFGPNPTAAYHVATQGRTQVIGTFSGAGDALQGEIAATTKKGSGLVKALDAAINATIADGSYAKVLDRWNLSGEAVTSSQVNPPGLPDTE
jgi:polar amino acid transport system substrate-binding protein